VAEANPISLELLVPSPAQFRGGQTTVGAAPVKSTSLHAQAPSSIAFFSQNCILISRNMVAAVAT
jgi:hypothetical protein